VGRTANRIVAIFHFSLIERPGGAGYGDNSRDCWEKKIMNNKTIKKRIHKNAKIVPEGERKCPICGETMHIEKIKGISTDVCEEHGIWLDKGEFTKITQMIKAKMILDKTIAVKHAKLEGKASGSVFGVWSFLFD